MNDNTTFEFPGSGGTVLFKRSTTIRCVEECKGAAEDSKDADDEKQSVDYINNKLHNNNRHNSKELHRGSTYATIARLASRIVRANTMSINQET